MCTDAVGPRPVAGGYRRFGGPRAPSGFTLIELLLALTLLAILTLMVTAGLQGLVGASRADSVINQLRTALNLARSEAVMRGTSVVICRVGANPQQCAGDQATGKLEWGQGWILYQDRNNNKSLELSSGDQILRQFEPVPAGFVLKWNRGDYVAYQPSGSLFSLSGSFCLDHPHSDGAWRRELRIPYTGRVRGTEDDCSFVVIP